MKTTSSPVKILAAATILLAGVVSSPAVTIQVTMTVDNSYALFTGTQTQATTFVGSDFNWPSAETYNFNLPAGGYIYVVTASDLSTAQGFLAEFNNLTDNYTFYSNDPQWQVMATGLGNTGAPYTGSAGDLALLSQEIVDANGGGNPSNGWVGTVGGPTNGAAPWGTIAGIDAAAEWVWHSANGDPDPTTPGFNHNEWIVFRIAVAATPTNPTGTPEGAWSLSLMGLGVLGLAMFRRFVK